MKVIRPRKVDRTEDIGDTQETAFRGWLQRPGGPGGGEEGGVRQLWGLNDADLDQTASVT